MMAQLHIQLLGGFQLTYDGTPLTTLTQGRQQALLAYLLLHHHAPQLRHQIAFRFWPETNDEQALKNLRRLLTGLFQACPTLKPWIVSNQRTLQWQNHLALQLDVAEFEQICQQIDHDSSRGVTDRLLPLAEQARQLYRGELLPGFYDEWVLAARQQFQELYHTLLLRLIDTWQQQGDYQTALRYTKLLLEHDPISEHAYYRLIELQALLGNTAGAIQTYRLCQAVLQRELDVEPGPALQALYQRLSQPKSPLVTLENQQLHLLMQLFTHWQQSTTEQQHFPGVLHFLTVLTDVLIKHKRLSEASTTLQAALTCLDTSNEPYWEAEIQRLQGLLWWQEGRPAKVVENCFNGAITLARQHKAYFLEIQAIHTLHQFYLGQGEAMPKTLSDSWGRWFNLGLTHEVLTGLMFFFNPSAHKFSEL